MKKIFATLFLIGFVGSAFAGHYSVVIKNTSDDGGRKTFGTTEVPNYLYKFTCDGNCTGILQKELTLKPGQRETEVEESIQKKNPAFIKARMKMNSEGGLQYQPHNEFISETGESVLIHELLLKYEKLLLTTQEEKFSMIGREGLDIIYKISKDKNQYTIDVYTGGDADQYQDLVTE